MRLHPVRTSRRESASLPTWKHEDQRKLRSMREGARGQPKRILKDAACVRDQHCNEGQRLGRKPEVGTFANSQVAGVAGENRRPVAVVLETVAATRSMFPKGNTRTAPRKSMLFEQTAEAFCWLRQQNRNPAHGVSQSGFCGCQSTESVLKISG